MTLGERFKYVRKNNKFNQVDFAKILGISQTHVSKIEKGVENPSETLLRFVSYMFAINLEWLKNETGTPHENKGLRDIFDASRKQSEDLMKLMTDAELMEFLDSFCYLNALYKFFFNEKKGFDDECFESLTNVMQSFFVLALHKKTTNDKECEHQVALLKDAVNEFVETMLRK